MKLTVTNENYVATVFRVQGVYDLPGLDNLKGVNVFGYQALTASANPASSDPRCDAKGKHVTECECYPGDLVLAFTAETELDNGYAYWNNLYKHENSNRDAEKGYLEDHRRIKAVKFRGHRSDALLMPLASLEGLVEEATISKLKEGDVFDTIDGFTVCRKYVNPNAKLQSGPTGKQVTDKQLIPKHFSTGNYFKLKHLLDPDKEVIVTQKLHGTSIRVGKIKVKRKLSWWEHVKKFYTYVPSHEVKTVIGSRNIMIPVDSDCLYGREGRKIAERLSVGETVYGELIGWDNDKPIQKGYTYNVPKGEAEFRIYRAVNETGEVPAVALIAFGFLMCPVLRVEKVDNFDANDYLDLSYNLDSYNWLHFPVPVDKDRVDEGVCIRQEGPIQPLILKAKSPKFLQYETKLADKEEISMEDVA